LPPRSEVVNPEIARVRASVVDDGEPAAVTRDDRIRPPGRRELAVGVLLEQHRIVRNVPAELVQQNLPAIWIRGVRKPPNDEVPAVVEPVDRVDAPRDLVIEPAAGSRLE